MVLNRQNDREAEDRRRDVGMHAKLDEMLIATKGARDEMAGIEELDEEEIKALNEQALAQIEATDGAAGKTKEIAIAKKSVDAAAERLVKRAKPSKNRATGLARAKSRRHPERPGRH